MTEDSRMFGRLATRTGRVTMPGTVRGGTTFELLAAGGRVPDDGDVERVLDSFELVFMRRFVRPEPPYRVPAAGYERHVTWRHWCFR